VLECAARPRWAYRLARHKRFTLRNLVEDEGVQAAVESVRRQQSYFYPEMSWADLDWVRSQWHGPVFVKGVMDPEDAETAVALGVDGIVVSNHGGRQLESGVGTLDVLPHIAEAVGDRTELLLDGGIRRGTDIAKALALGARAVLVGRAYVYGLAVAGSTGVEAVLELLRSELVRTLQLMGCPSAADLDRDRLLGISPVSVHTRKT
jgi:L-lactate dehydrogenase (cytochrome)/(S)-mandelate dehydrogenase